MSKHIFLWSALYNGTGVSKNEPLEYCVYRWKERQDLLARHNLELRLFAPKKEYCDEGIFPVLDYFHAKEPDIIVEYPGEATSKDIEDYSNVVRWPRDFFQIFGTNICAQSPNFKALKNLLASYEHSLHPVLSNVGIGGFSIRVPGIVVIADVASISTSALFGIRDSGYELHKVPVATTQTKLSGVLGKTLYNRMKYNRHIDPEINCAMTAGSNMLLVATAEYHHCFADEVATLRKKLDAKLYVLTDPAEIKIKGVNFVQFPDGAMMLSQKHKNVFAFLRRNLGYAVHSIPTFWDECSFINGAGGLRCRTNVFYGY